MAYGTGGTTSGYNNHTVGTVGYCQIIQSFDSPVSTIQKWSQPLLESNTGNPEMTVTGMNEGQGAGYRAFDGKENTVWGTANGVVSDTMNIYIRKNLYLKSVTIRGLKNDYGQTNTATLFYDGTSAGQKTFNYNSSDAVTWTFSTPVRARQLSIAFTGTTWIAVKEITIDADMDLDSYEMFEKTEAYAKLPHEVVREYYKYQDYTLPIMTSINTPAGLVEYDVSVTGNGTQLYPLFFGDCVVTIDCYRSNTSTSRYIKYYFENLLAKGEYTLSYNGLAQQNVSLTQNQWVAIYEDNTSVEIMSELFTSTLQTLTTTFIAEKPIKAIQLNITGECSTTNYCDIEIRNLSLTAKGSTTNNVKVIDNTNKGSKSDYDYYVDNIKYYGIQE